MKAIVYTEYGPPEVLKLQEVEVPAPRADQVLVKIHAASVNDGDTSMVRGSPFVVRLSPGGLREPKFKIPGGDIAGRIEAAGPGARQFQPGDEVFGDIGASGFGAFAQYVAVPENVLAPKPAGASFEQAASVCQAAVVALQGLRDTGQIQPGQEVLINGASGGVGTFAVQIAKALGARVTGVCSTPNLDLVRSIGADQVIDYTQEDFTQGQQRYDLIFDNVANRPLSDLTAVLAPQGVHISCAFSAAALFRGPFISMFGGKKVVQLTHSPNAADLVFMTELLETGQVVPVIDRQYPLSEVAEAFRHMAKGPQGKVVITVEHSDGG